MTREHGTINSCQGCSVQRLTSQRRPCCLVHSLHTPPPSLSLSLSIAIYWHSIYYSRPTVHWPVWHRWSDQLRPHSVARNWWWGGSVSGFHDIDTIFSVRPTLRTTVWPVSSCCRYQLCYGNGKYKRHLYLLLWSNFITEALRYGTLCRRIAQYPQTEWIIPCRRRWSSFIDPEWIGGWVGLGTTVSEQSSRTFRGGYSGHDSLG